MLFVAILYVIPRKCPKPGQILAETWWNIQTCETDGDCWPRVCCPDGRLKYCRISQPEFESSSIPVARQLASRKFLKCIKKDFYVRFSLQLLSLWRNTFNVRHHRHLSLIRIPKPATTHSIASRISVVLKPANDIVVHRNAQFSPYSPALPRDSQMSVSFAIGPKI